MAGMGGACPHLYAAAALSNKGYLQFIPAEMQLETFNNQYAAVSEPRALPAIDLSASGSESKTLKVPLVGRPARGSGKPPGQGRKRGGLELGLGGARSGKQQQCGRCKRFGHNKTKCKRAAKNLLAEASENEEENG